MYLNSRVPERFIHAPGRCRRPIWAAARCRIGGDYPAPTSIGASARERTLPCFEVVRGAEAGM